MRRSLVFLPLIVFLITACTPAATIQPSATPLHSATSILPTATPTVAACMQAGGRVEFDQYTTELLPDPFAYHVYLPPCYDEQADRSYPVLYLVHGKNAAETQWINLGVPLTLDRLAADGELAPFLVVMPRDRIWADPTVDRFGLAVVESLVPRVDEHFRTLTDREYRAIGGLSRGGAWALHIGFSYPELFGAVGMHSGVLFDTDVTKLDQWLMDLPEGMTPRIYTDIGDQDRPDIMTLATYVESQLTKYEIPHEWHLYEGGHNDTYWRAHIEEYLRWYGAEW